MTTRTKNLLWRSYAYVVAALVLFLVGSVVLATKSMNLRTDIWAAETQMYDADTLIIHVDDSLNLCYNLGFIPYPLNWYISEEAYQLTRPR